MNLKHYALSYEKPELVWLDGQLLKINHGVSDEALIDLSLAIICNSHLKKLLALGLGEDSPRKESWDILIEKSRYELDMALKKLGDVQ